MKATVTAFRKALNLPSSYRIAGSIETYEASGEGRNFTITTVQLVSSTAGHVTVYAKHYSHDGLIREVAKNDFVFAAGEAIS